MTLKEFRAAPHDSRREVIAVRMVDALAGHLWVWGKKNAPAHVTQKANANTATRSPIGFLHLQFLKVLRAR